MHRQATLAKRVHASQVFDILLLLFGNQFDPFTIDMLLATPRVRWADQKMQKFVQSASLV